MLVHLVSSTEFMTQGTGVHSAFIEMKNLLKEKDDIDVITNGEGKGDIFHSHSYGLYYFFKSIGYRGRRIHTVHTTPDTLRGSIIFPDLIMPFSNLYFKMVYNHADVCIAISPAVEKKLEELGVKSRIVRLDNPIDLTKWQTTPDQKLTARKKLGISPSKFVVLGVGQIQKRKGIEDFIDMAARFPEMEFVWVGGRPFGLVTEGISRINQKIAGATPNVKFPGMKSQDEMPDVYAAADLLVFPSFQENSPLVPLEAASAGLPVIYRNLPEYKLLYKKPYLSASNTEEFCILIDKIYSDAGFRIQAEQTSAELITQFDKNVIREKLLSLYEDVYLSANKKVHIQPHLATVKLRTWLGNG